METGAEDTGAEDTGVERARRRRLSMAIGAVVFLLATVVAIGLAVALGLGADGDGLSDEERARRDPGRCPAPTQDGVYVRVVHGEPLDWCLYIDLDNHVIVDSDDVVFAAPVG